VRAPNITYRYNLPIDLAGPTIQTFSRSIFTSASATTITLSIEGVPKDKILILSNAVSEASPGAAQSCTTQALRGRTVAALAFTIDLNTPVPVADQAIAHNWQGEVWVAGAGENATTVELITVFSAAVAANRADLHLFGLIIPRANVAIF